MNKRAYFVKNPRRIEELRAPHLPEQERPYAIAGEVTLSVLDFENFAADLLADRAFLRVLTEPEHGDMFSACLLIREKNLRAGILVVPTRDHHVRYAAYLPTKT